MAVPDRSTALRLLAESGLPDGVVVHSRGVARVAIAAAGLVAEAQIPVDGALVEAALLQRHALPPVDLLKVGHHGSRTSTTPALLDALRPSIAVISVGAGNEYGHPAPETLATLAARSGLAVYRTDLQGDV